MSSEARACLDSLEELDELKRRVVVADVVVQSRVEDDLLDLTGCHLRCDGRGAAGEDGGYTKG
jgi:hypothetical protein